MKSNGAITITKLKDENMEDEVVVPAQIESLPVTRIGDRSFYDCRGLTIRASRGSAAEQYVRECAAKEELQFEATS